MTIVTIFVDHKANMRHEQEMDFLSLASFPPVAPEKKALPWIKLARFGDVFSTRGSLRHNKNVISLSGVEVDYDSEAVSLDEAAAKLSEAGIEAFFYTSPSHTEETPRWRILLPFQDEYQASMEEMDLYRKNAIDRIEAVLGFQVANESKTLSQSFYYGRVENCAYRTNQVDGACIDTLFDLSATPRRRKGKKGMILGAHSSLNVHAALRQVLTGEHLHEPLRGLAASFVKTGMRPVDVVATLQALMDASRENGSERWEDRRQSIVRLVASAEEKYGRQQQRIELLHELRIIYQASRFIRKGEALDDNDHKRLEAAIHAIEQEGNYLNGK
jgi:hypothetical protein